jgi:peptide/nickel transport system permease protein
MTGMRIQPRETLAGASTAPGLRLRRRAGSRRHRSVKERIGIGLLLLFLAMAIFGPIVAPYDPSAPSSTVLSGPTAAHLLGTTQTGQDVLSQLLVGARPSIVVALGAAAVATFISVVVGIASGYLRPVAAESLSVLTNVFLVIPALPLAIVIAGYLPTHGSLAVAAVVALTGWSWGARALRAQTLSLRRRDFVTAARIMGESRTRIIFWEIGPNVFPIILSSFLFTSLYAIVTQASLAFLGLVDPSKWSWGVMLYWVQNFQAFTLGAWWWYVPPGLCIALFGMALSLVSFGADERINPRLRVVREPRRKRRSRSEVGTS